MALCLLMFYYLFNFPQLLLVVITGGSLVRILDVVKEGGRILGGGFDS